MGGGPEPGGELRNGSVEGLSPEAAEAPWSMRPGSPASPGMPGYRACG